jgi:hypothetical protein
MRQRSRLLIVGGLAAAVFLVGTAWVGAAWGLGQQRAPGHTARHVPPSRKRRAHPAPSTANPPPAVNKTGPVGWTPEQMANAKPATPGVGG